MYRRMIATQQPAHLCGTSAIALKSSTMEWLNSDDSDILATLAVLDAWCENPVPVSATIDKPSFTSTSVPKRPSINVSRVRRKQELTPLRDELSQLRVTHESLQQRRPRMLQSHRDGRNGRPVTKAPMWEAIARRQAGTRKRSEAENANIRNAVRTQHKITMELVRLLQQAAQDSRSPCCTKRDDRYITDQDQLRRVELDCMLWPRLFSSPSTTIFQTQEVDFYNAHVVTPTAYEAIHEVHTSVPLPFSVGQVKAAAWAICVGHRRGHDAQSIANTMVLAEDVGPITVSGHDRTIHTRYAVKSFRDDDTGQGLFVNACSVVRGCHTPLDGLTIDVDLWVRIADGSTLGLVQLPAPFTVVQFVRKARIDLRKADAPSELRNLTLTISLVKCERTRTGFDRSLKTTCSGNAQCRGSMCATDFHE